jgi:CheY-like chemotaxis protein
LPPSPASITACARSPRPSRPGSCTCSRSSWSRPTGCRPEGAAAVRLASPAHPADRDHYGGRGVGVGDALGGGQARARVGDRARVRGGNRRSASSRFAAAPGDHLRLPASTAQRDARPGASGRTARRMNEVRRVLVLDDEPQILRTRRVILRDAGFEVDTAATAEQALAAAAARPPAGRGDSRPDLAGPPAATWRCGRGACILASSRAGAGPPPAPPVSGECGVLGSFAAWHPRPSR